jgi:DNA-directed RNA polymerase subunit RPC12/RpoP
VAGSQPEQQKLRREFMSFAGEVFDAMFDKDQQEQLITLTQREDRVLEKGAGLQQWLLARHLANDPAAASAPSVSVACPKCGHAGLPDAKNTKPAPRRIKTRAGPQDLKRRRYRCPKCRKIFFPPGCEA